MFSVLGTTMNPNYTSTEESLGDDLSNILIEGSKKADIAFVEVGGTVGDIESLPFLEAIRQLGLELGKSNAIFIHLTLLPLIEVTNEVKTKPTQHSVKELRSIGIQPDILLCRAKNNIKQSLKEKLALFTNVSKKAVFSAVDAKSIYDIPILLREQKIDDCIIQNLKLKFSFFKTPNSNKDEEMSQPITVKSNASFNLTPMSV